MRGNRASSVVVLPGRRSKCHPTAIAALAVVAVLAGAAPAAKATATVASRPVTDSRGATGDYWTPARMRAARPADLVVTADGRVARPIAPAAAPAARDDAEDASGASLGAGRVNGKVFVHYEGGSQPGDFVCSATAVRSNARTAVMTAGHCVYDAQFGSGFATAWMFVPGYRGGQAPYGQWFAERLLTTDGWRSSADLRLDAGVAVVGRDEEGRGIEDVVGGRPVGFNRAREQDYTAFGYPALPNPLSVPPRVDFDGERLYTCSSQLAGSDSSAPGNGPDPIEIACDMTGGSSGGAWVGGDGSALGVTSYGYDDDPEHLYSPYFGAAVRDLYRAASGPRLICAGTPVTNLGAGGPQDYRGGAEADVFDLGGGADRAAGRGAADRACGRGGRDRLSGGPGTDRLLGGPGRDVLIGGPGRDRCDGGPGRDREISCETRGRR